MQWSELTEKKQKDELAQTEFRFVKTITIIWAAAITRSPSPLYQRCTAAKDGKLQDSLREQTNAVKCVD